MKILIAILSIALLIGIGYQKFHEITSPLPVPIIDTTKYWGPGDGAKYEADTSIKPFKIHYDEEINNLRLQLNRTFFTAPLEGINFEYGFNSVALEQLVKYWRNDYLAKWTEREKYLNKFTQYTTEIQGLRIHFIHAKPVAEMQGKKKQVIPLLLLHGWPGSVREFYDIIPLLTEASEKSPYVFEVIAPSLVGYGWSEPAAKIGFNAAHMATVMRNLMLRIGHEQFLVQGGDWGSIIGGILSTLYPENVLGYHSNMCIVNTPLAMFKLFVASFQPEKFVPSRSFLEHHFPALEKFKLLIQESGYFHLQATKPDTIGAVLLQNPVGLAAYILEKFQSVTGDNYVQKLNALAEVYGLDAVLDNVMIYYLTNSATTAGRFYAENSATEFRHMQLDRVPSPVPMGCARFKNDLPAAFDWQLRDKFPNLIHSKYFNEGGHFAALEVPKLLFTDFMEFVSKVNLAK